MHYADKAKNVIERLYENGKNKKNMVTTTKLRGLLSGMSDIYNDVVLLENDTLPEDINNRLEYLRVQFVYECGRDNKVKNFIDQAKLIDYLGSINGSKKSFITVERYMEALVAYHRYYGGRDE